MTRDPAMRRSAGTASRVALARGDECPFRLAAPPLDYDRFGESFGVPLHTRPVAGALAWLNTDWFRENGVAVDKPSVRAAVEAWLLRTFAVETAPASDARGKQGFRADRYGGHNGTIHGGSGRAAYLGRFNVKGIGATPLIPAGLPNHSDGRLLLVDAVREAIYAELCHRETLHGAVRTIAIIAKPPFDGPPDQRNCLIVRPNFVRPAHFERSLIFGTAGTRDSDQYQDALRTERVRAHLRTEGPGIERVIQRLAMQTGSMDAMRLVQGLYTSGNVSLEGEVADFGSFRLMPNWRYMRQIRNDHDVFGKDLDHLKTNAANWARIFGRRIDKAALHLEIDAGHRAGFDRALAAVLCLGDAHAETARAVAALLHGVFAGNQRAGSGATRWPFEPEAPGGAPPSLEPLAALLRTHGVSAENTHSALARLALWALPRDDFSFSAVNPVIEALIAGSTAGALGAGLAAFIRRSVSLNRRIFGRYPARYVPIGHADSDAGCVLYVVDPRSDQHCAIVFAAGAKALDDNPVQEIVECGAGAVEQGCEIVRDGRRLRLPPADIAYNADRAGASMRR